MRSHWLRFFERASAAPVMRSPTLSLLRPGLLGIRRHLVPGLVLQAFALLLLIGYVSVPAMSAWLDAVGDLKQRWGFAYSATSTALFGGVIPFGILLATGRVRRGSWGAEGAFYVVFWLYKGMEVDLLYRLQDVWFGQQASPGSVLLKVVVDQFVYNPLWAAPTQALCFLWKDSGFRLTTVRESLQREGLLRRVLTVLMSTWLVWVPTVSVVYSLPSPVQIPLFNLALCFWSLLLSFISQHTSEAACATP